MIALSLMVLAGYGGMVSLIQMTVAALAGYVVAILGTSGVPQISLGWPWWLHIPLAILIATLFGTLVGALAVRTEGIYTIMITLAIAAAFFYTRQNYAIFNGYTGFNNVVPPALFGIDWRQPVPFYYLTLGCAALSYLAVVWMARTPFGLALQGVRDNPRRGARSASGHRPSHSGLLVRKPIAAFGGILLVWQNAQVVPGTAGIPQVIDILVIAVVGGLKRRSARSSGRSTFCSACSRPIFCDVRDGRRAVQARRWVGLSGCRVVLTRWRARCGSASGPAWGAASATCDRRRGGAAVMPSRRRAPERWGIGQRAGAARRHADVRRARRAHGRHDQRAPASAARAGSNGAGKTTPTASPATSAEPRGPFASSART